MAEAHSYAIERALAKESTEIMPIVGDTEVALAGEGAEVAPANATSAGTAN